MHQVQQVVAEAGVGSLISLKGCRQLARQHVKPAASETGQCSPSKGDCKTPAVRCAAPLCAWAAEHRVGSCCKTYEHGTSGPANPWHAGMQAASLNPTGVTAGLLLSLLLHVPLTLVPRMLSAVLHAGPPPSQCDAWPAHRAATSEAHRSCCHQQALGQYWRGHVSPSQTSHISSQKGLQQHACKAAH